MWSLKIVYHFWMRIFSGRVPVCAASSFFRSPTVSSSLHLTRIFFPSRSLHMTCQRDGERARKRARVKCGSERSARLARRARRDGGAAAARADLYHVRAATGARSASREHCAAENETLRAQGPGGGTLFLLLRELPLCWS